jgi:hypothetical protein
MRERRLNRGKRQSADASVAEAAGEEWGVLSVHELRACGLTDHSIARRVRSGWLTRLYPAVYAVGHVSEARESRWLAAVKACGEDAVAAFRSAGEIWELLEDPDGHLPEVIVPGPGTRTVPGIRVHRSRCLSVRDTTRHRGIPVTTPERTLIDLASVLSERALRQAVRRAHGHKRVSIRSLLRALDRLGPRRGTKRLRRIVATGPAPTRNGFEDLVLDLLLAAGFEHPEVNAPLSINGRRIVPDFRWPRQRLIVEVDGARWHDQALDAERQALLEAHGEQVVRVTWEQATMHAAATVARIERAGAPRRLAPASRSRRSAAPAGRARRR